ncbi:MULTISPECIES: Flp family type IVb pilin [unclassified Rhizobium]|uniref:Flp family type IVb pilin n=1 Tax=unclassified Rhizobium TaxID=2613769 RepID=UPI001AE32195|nr:MULTISPECIES: Flp family type IVb pilin [unclassified Rhizobium]MBP2459633.1 pilus assembly protein Flp/PilA [Rhizobium sp. PvP014]MBP2531927.1 pilus assembly protein Flp/PilA [Rhizobium sp. PvP099]
MRLLRSFMRDECGATAVEYGLIIGIISAALLAGFGAFSSALSNMFSFLGGKVDKPIT